MNPPVDPNLWTRKEVVSLVAQVAPAALAAVATIWAAIAASKSAKAAKNTIDTMVQQHKDQEKYNKPILEAIGIMAIKDVNYKTTTFGDQQLVSSFCERISISLKNKKELNIAFLKGIWMLLDSKNDYLDAGYFNEPRHLNPSPIVKIGIFGPKLIGYTSTKMASDIISMKVFIHLQVEDQFGNASYSAFTFHTTLGNPFSPNEDINIYIPEDSIIVAAAALTAFDRTNFKKDNKIREYVTEFDLNDIYIPYSLASTLWFKQEVNKNNGKMKMNPPFTDMPS